ncbi:hypothetical protein [Rhodococcus sp. ABRD24]|uniref:hypothetical protein n=1 Tax=Rhodococcus sp. ABRD24 TaxID=2507582 RepID=UPI0013F14735|nr:hypothetical protein [Rhodococcus sp. ABRD24]
MTVPAGLFPGRAFPDEVPQTVPADVVVTWRFGPEASSARVHTPLQRTRAE